VSPPGARDRPEESLAPAGKAPDDSPAPWRLSVAWGLALPLGWGLLRLAALVPAWVDAGYSRTVFPLVRMVLRAFAALLPFHLMEVLLGLGLLWLLWLARRAGQSWWRRRRSPSNLLLHGLARSLRVAGALYLVFLGTWGLNHARLPYAEHAGLAVAEVSVAELDALTGELVAECNRLKAGLDPLALELAADRDGMDPRLTAAFGRLAEEVPVLAGGRPLVRRAWLSPVLSFLGISGIYSPFTAEAHLNDEVPVHAHAFNAAHEVAHFLGFAREDEASFIAWQVCRRAADPALRYSGTLEAMRSCAGALAYADPSRAEARWRELDPAVLADVRASRDFWASKRSFLTSVSRLSNDLYLKSQGQAEGTASYGRVVDLLVAEWRAAQRGETRR